MKRELRGSCHCGAVRFSCLVDLAAPTVRCNCSICAKARYWLAVVPVPDFQLEQGEAELTDYRFGSESICHRFCRHCGIKTFGVVAGAPEPFFGVNVACLALTPEELAAIPIHYNDGRHDAHGRAPSLTSYL